MNYDHKHQLAFLLSLAALPIGGCVISDGDDDGDSGDDTGTASNTNPMTADDDSGSMTATMTADDTGPVTLDDSGSSSGGSDDTAGTTGGDVPQVCTDAGAHYEKCMFTDAEEIVTQCVYYVVEMGYTGDCLTANEDYYACLVATPCEDFDPKSNPCQAAIETINEVCGGGTDSGSSDSGGSESSTGG